jgi:hypothetical protein
MASRGRKTTPPKSPKARKNARLRKRRYVQRNEARRKLSNKLAWIQKRYGQEARAYFLACPFCERCPRDRPETRIACLAVHHPHGKTVRKFETICHNCHAVHHGSSFTVKDCLK